MCKYALGVKFYLKCAAATECCKFHSHFDYTNPREYVRFRFPLLLLPGGTSKCESLVCEGSNRSCAAFHTIVATQCGTISCMPRPSKKDAQSRGKLHLILINIRHTAARCTLYVALVACNSRERRLIKVSSKFVL